jgi:acyl-CoA thioester hydrolase
MEGYPFTSVVEVRYRDIDAMNHVNNAVYVTFLEVVRTRLWRERLAFSGTAREFPFIVARVAVDYRSPIDINDRVEIGVGVSRIGRTSFTLAYRIEAAGRLAAEAESVQVLYDHAQGRSRALDGEMRTRLEAMRLHD